MRRSSTAVLALCLALTGTTAGCSRNRSSRDASVAAAEQPNHRLADGPALSVDIDTDKVLRPVNRQAMGMSLVTVRLDYAGFYAMADGSWVLDPDAAAALRRLNLPFTRFYGIDDDPWSIGDSLDKIAAIAERLGGIPLSNITLELETAEEKGKKLLDPAVWEEAARHAATAGQRFRLWEVGNEVAIADPRNGGTINWRDYSDHVQAVSARIKAVSPENQVGLSVDSQGLAADPPSGDWTEGVIARTSGSYDFVSPHLYFHVGGWTGTPGVDQRPLEQVSLYGNFQMFRSALRLRQLLRKHNPGREIAIVDTEWGLHGYTAAEPERAYRVNRNGNIVGALHRAIRLVYYLREGLVDAAGQWSALSGMGDGSRGADPGFLAVPMVQRDGKEGVHFYLNDQFRRTLGDEVLDLSGSCPYFRFQDLAGPKVAVLATRSADRQRMYLILANGTAAEDIPATIRWRTWRAASASGVRLSQAGLDDPALVSEREVLAPAEGVTVNDDGRALALVVPAHTILFLTAVER